MWISSWCWEGGGGLGGGGNGSSGGSGPRGPRLAATLLAIPPLSFTSASSACTWLDTFYVMVEAGGIGKADVQQLWRRWTAPWQIVAAEALGQGRGWLRWVGKGLEQC